MRQFFWRFLICLAPCIWAGWVTGAAVDKYLRGQSGGFKLGVDLVGGTILVYEIDTRKSLEDNKAGKSTDATTLAEALKRRIDPNDLYNIVIRPAGGEGRVEIVLPTGGAHRTRIAEENWDNEVLKYFQKKYKLNDLEVGRGRVNELAETIHLRLSEEIWENKLFKAQPAWDDLLKKAQSKEDWVVLQTKPEVAKELFKLPAGDLKQFVEFVRRSVGGTTTDNLVELWVKDQAWKDLLENARKKWPELQQHATEMDRIPRDSYEQLVTFIQAKGNVINQAAISALEPLMGKQFIAENSKQFNKRKEIVDFIEANYGPSLDEITKEIQERYRQSGATRDLTLEEVQRIKDLVARVGSLEFRILANSTDDAKAIEDAKKLINQTAQPEELKKLGQEGRLPPAPMNADGKPEFYTLKLPRNQKSRVSYSWVELGKQERRQLGLDNAAQNDAKRNKFWNQMAGVNRGKAMQLEEPSSTRGKKILQGALFYSRECKDRNLPEAERTEKKIEYFVLARNPETINPDDLLETRLTSKIDGRYLRNAYADRTGVSPAVHFTFNNTGGELFGTLTRKNVPSGEGSEETQVKRHLAIVLDGQVTSAPTINSEIRSQGQITGNFTIREVNDLVNILRGGALPASLKPQPVSESTMGPGLGQDTINNGLFGVVIALAAVVLFMLIYYRFSGFVASVALMANLLLTVGFMVAVQATFTLPGLAGLVLSLGMAVDANVLIYERLREERERGATLALAIRNAYDRALPTIIDTHMTSIFTAIVLYVVGNDQLKGFGVSLTAGLVISLFTSLYITRFMFDFWLHMGWLKKLSMLRFFAQPDIDFMAVRKYWFTATIVLSILGVSMFVARLPNDLNIDFIGGTAYTGQLSKNVGIAQLREFVSKENQDRLLEIEPGEGARPKVTEDKDSDGLRFQVVYLNPDKTTEARVVQLANKPDGIGPSEREEEVARRLSTLPDASVEQLFLSAVDQPKDDKEQDRSKSPYFKIRTSERETEIVQTVLDRLLREKKGNDYSSVMRRVYVWASPLEKKGTRLYFYKDEPPKDFDPSKEYRKDAKEQIPVDYASPSFVKTLFTREMLDRFGKKDREELPLTFGVDGEGKSRDGRFQSMTLEFNEDLKPDQVEKVQAALAKTLTEFSKRPQPDSLENFDSQLSAETRIRAMWAIVASWGAILLYLWFRFGSWTFGLAAVLCLIHNLAFIVGVVAACHYIYDTWIGSILLLDDFKFDLTAVAALLTMVGYCVNDTIVIFDRIREVRGKNPDLTPQMINDTINQTLSRTLVTSVSVFLVVLVLYIIGGPGVHLFSFIIMLGVLIGTYSSIYVASPLLLILGEGTRGKARARVRQQQPQPEGASA